jgi:D-alanyl-D-alanine carboxypeptidase
MHRSRVAVVVLLSLLVATSARADRIDDYVRAQMQASHLPGLALAIVEDGKVIKIQAYGLSDVARREPARSETIFKIGSVSKQFIATAIMLLVQDARLGVDDPVSRHLEGIPAAWGPITIRHLLTHTGGLVRESPAFEPTKVKTDLEVIKGAYHLPLRFSPGSKWEYSNLGYFVLAEIATRVAGKSWSRFLQERVFGPAGMAWTAPTNVTPALPNRALGYTGNDNQRLADDWVALRPSGAFLSTVGDLAKWDALLYTDRVLTETSRKQMWAPVRLNDDTTHPYGFGWHVETRSDGRRVIWHGGRMPGFVSHFGRFLDNRLAVVVLTNGDDVDIAALANGLADLHLKSRQPATR